jgi:sodium-dependent dicarboxylate transporter 2/3/5
VTDLDAPDAYDRKRLAVARAGLFGGPVLAVATYLALPEDVTTTTGEVVVLGQPGRATAAVGVLMAVWWMTEAIELAATALLPLALLPLLQAVSIDEAAAPYANPLIFLFLGGFLLALSMQRWGLERRIALIALRLVGTDPRRVVGGVMLITAVFSMWVSNTATAAMMLPVALSLIDEAVPGGRAAVTSREPQPGQNFARSLLLGIAISASIGGVGTLIGTPPNLFLASFSRETLGEDISFVAWLAIGIPIMAVFLPIAWILLTRVLFPPDVDAANLAKVIDDEARRSAEPMSRGEWATFIVFSLTVLAWVFRPLLDDLAIGDTRPLEGLTDAGIAVIAGLVLFIIPTGRRRGEYVMDWATASKIPWGILLLFGGGLSLAAAIEVTGVAEYLGVQAEALDVLPPLLVVVAIAAGVVFLTELTSNTATAAALIPIFAAVAPGLGLDPLALAVPTALAASLAFMMPVGTPPNAIVFGSGMIRLPDMMRTGLRLNIVSIAIITAATVLLAAPVLGFDIPLW